MIRDYIKENFKNSNLNDIRSSIENSIEEKKEETLPGMGVLFEILWINSENSFKEEITKIIKANI